MKTSIHFVKRPSESFADIIRIARLCSGAVGADISNPNYRINWITILVFNIIIFYFLFTIATIWKEFNDNWTIILEASCMIGAVIQGLTKLIVGIVYTKRFTAGRFQLEDLYKEYEKRGPKYCAALNTSCYKIRRVLMVIGVTWSICVLAIIISPFIMLVVNGSRQMMIIFYIPGIDVETSVGYYVTLGFQGLCMCAGGFGLYAGDIFALVFFTQFFLFVDIVNLKIEEINALLEASIEKNRDHDRKHISDCLIDIVKWHQLYLNFAKESNELFVVIVSVQVTLSAASILLTLYVIVAADWTGAYPFLLISIYAMYVYCILGTQIEICNDNFCYAIYNISWYNLNVSEQKIVRLMLMQSQSPNLISVAGVMPLSVNTGLQISKSIYSILMMMLKFLHK